MRAIVFDFDGLIIDTETPWYEAFRQIYQEHGCELPLDQWLLCVGTTFSSFDPYEYLERLLKRELDRKRLQAIGERKHRELMEKQDIRPGVLDYLTSARESGLKIGLASSSSGSWVEPFLRKHGLYGYFDAIVTADLVAKVKPDPELYIKALDALGVSGDEAVAFEDSLNGLKAARAAGLHCVIVPNAITRHLEFDDYSMRLSSMSEMSLSQVLKRLKPA